jgi:hypothetical protein
MIRLLVLFDRRLLEPAGTMTPLSSFAGCRLNVVALEPVRKGGTCKLFDQFIIRKIFSSVT